MAPPRPVTLRDFLELGCDSSSDGFRSFPRRVPRADAPQPPARLEALAECEADADALRRSPSSSSHSQRSPSSSPFSRPGALARISSLSRSLSRRIKEGLWRRRFDDGDDAYFDDRDSCGFPSPLVSSCSASDSDEADDVTAQDKPAASAPASECSEKDSSSSSTAADREDLGTDGVPRAACAADGNKMQQAVAEEGESAVGRKLGMEDKQQLSPVSVLDFPFDDDDGEEEGSDAGTCSPAFQRRPPPDHLHIIRTKQQQLAVHKVRRYDPVDLDARFASESESGESVGASTRLATSSSSTTDSSSGSGTATTTAPRHDDEEEEHQSVHQPSPQEKEPDPDDDEYRLLARLLQDQEGGFAACLLADDEVARALVLDFFAEGVDRLRSVVGTVSGRRVAAAEEALVGTAAEWLRGGGPRWGVADVVLSGKAALADMERGRRWMCVVGEEDRDVGVEVEGVVVDALVDELVTELVEPWWWWW